MAEDRFIISSSPHIRSPETVSGIMFNVLYALVPVTLASIYFFGLAALKLILTCTLVAVATEYLFQKFRGLEPTVDDGSALVTGLLLALTLPPGLGAFLAGLGAVVAIALGKQVFGGLGHNPFNPALIGRAFLMISFPVRMTTWPEWAPNAAGIDGVTQATPLQLLQEGVTTGYSTLFWGGAGGSLGEISAVAILIGGLYLVWREYADWRIPLGILGTFALLSLVVGEDPLFHLMAGGLLFGAFFMATDMVTSPVTRRGRWLFAVGIAFMVFLIRFYGGYPEGVMFAILLMNTAVPLIDKYTVPRILGEVTESG